MDDSVDCGDTVPSQEHTEAPAATLCSEEWVKTLIFSIRGVKDMRVNT